MIRFTLFTRRFSRNILRYKDNEGIWCLYQDFIDDVIKVENRYSKVILELENKVKELEKKLYES